MELSKLEAHAKHGDMGPYSKQIAELIAIIRRQESELSRKLRIKVKRELFSFSSEQDWINKAQSRYANCGVRKEMYITIDANGHVMHMGKCFSSATAANAFPVTVYELETNWASGDKS